MHLQVKFSQQSSPLRLISPPQLITNAKQCWNGFIVKEVLCIRGEHGREFIILVVLSEERLLKTHILRYA